jgi:hypothetical protein
VPVEFVAAAAEFAVHGPRIIHIGQVFVSIPTGTAISDTANERTGALGSLRDSCKVSSTGAPPATSGAITYMSL